MKHLLWVPVLALGFFLFLLQSSAFAEEVTMSFNGGDPTFTCDTEAETGTAQLGEYELEYEAPSVGSAGGNQSFTFTDSETGGSAVFMKFVHPDQPDKWVLYYKPCDTCPTQIIPLTVD